MTLAAAVPAGVYAAQAGEGSSQAGGKKALVSELQERAEKVRELRDSWIWADGLHRETYMLLLAEKYVPASVPDWEAAFAEREAVMDQLKELQPLETRKEEWQSKLEEQKEKLKNGEITLKELQQNVEAWKNNMKDAWEKKREELRPIMEETKALKEEFDAAIESGDAEAIAAVLPAMLAHYEDVTDRLEKKLEQWETSV
jgi:hypothetical protein